MVPPLLYADDMVLLATSAAGLQQQLRLLEAYCAERGLAVNIDKTRVMLPSGADDSSRLGKRQQQQQQTPAKAATAAATDTARREAEVLAQRAAHAAHLWRPTG